jgi:hypothetical protein
MYDPRFDTLGRKRPVGRQPEGKDVSPFDYDLDLLAFAHHMGGMATSQLLFEYAKSKGYYTTATAMSRRMRDLYHDSGYWIRERENKYSYVTHQVSEIGENLLKKEGLYSPLAPSPFGAFEHQKMVACIYQAFYLDCLHNGIKIVRQHELEAPSVFKAPYAGKERPLYPDAVFLIYLKDKPILIFLECDRGSEPGRSKDPNRKSWVKNATQYRHIIGTREYKKHYNLPPETRAMVLAVTSAPSYVNRILDSVHKVFPDGCPFIMVNHVDSFGDMFYVNTRFKMFERVWQRAGDDDFQFST